MKIALAHWSGRISPVFDVTDHVVLITAANGRETHRVDLRLDGCDPFARARKLAEAQVSVLLCGAVSAALEKALAAAGVQVIGFLGGEVEGILKTFLNGQLRDGRLPPNACAPTRRRCGQTGRRRHTTERQDPMKIAVSAAGSSLEDVVDPRFGRCACFLIINPDTLAVEVLDNTGRQLSGGAGVDAAQRVADRGVTHVLTGTCGPNAQKILSAAGVRIVDGCSGTVREAVLNFRAAPVASAQQPPDGAGTGPEAPSSAAVCAPGTGRSGNPAGLGSGRGMGRGGGRGMGRGCGMGAGRRGQGGNSGRRSG
jgi:predicted Fe-Mo cluster-binding NifX family protein